MKRTHNALILMVCLQCSASAIAEHQTHLRAIVNVPGLQVAVLETDHDLGKGSARPTVITNTRWVSAGDQFEDDTIKGHHFQFEIIEADLARETIKTREAGQEHTYSFPAPNRPATAKGWLHFENTRFTDVLDVYSRLMSRTILLHPAIDSAPVSLEVVWTNVPSKAEIALAFVKFMNQREASAIEDGDKFLQLIPTSLSQTALARSKDLPASPADFGGGLFVGVDTNTLLDTYGRLSKRRRTGGLVPPSVVPYLKAEQSLSNAEAMYAFETLLAWSGLKIILDGDDTFSISWQPR